MTPSWPKAVIFDLDGTLVDTIEDIATALNRAFAEFGLPPHPTNTVRRIVGGGFNTLLDRALDLHAATLNNSDKTKIAQRILDHYAVTFCAASHLFPGAVETLAVLADNGVALGVCTNKPHNVSLELLDALGVADRFGCVHGADPGRPKKPDPASILRVLEALGAEPTATVMVGDSVTDVEAARAAGLAAVVLVSFGYTEKPASELGADAVIDSLDRLPSVLAELALTAQDA